MKHSFFKHIANIPTASALTTQKILQNLNPQYIETEHFIIITTDQAKSSGKSNDDWIEINTSTQMIGVFDNVSNGKKNRKIEFKQALEQAIRYTLDPPFALLKSISASFNNNTQHKLESLTCAILLQPTTNPLTHTDHIPATDNHITLSEEVQTHVEKLISNRLNKPDSRQPSSFAYFNGSPFREELQSTSANERINLRHRFPTIGHIRNFLDAMISHGFEGRMVPALPCGEDDIIHRTVNVESGDIIVLGSDGIFDVLCAKNILDILRNSFSLEEAHCTIYHIIDTFNQACESDYWDNEINPSFDENNIPTYALKPFSFEFLLDNKTVIIPTHPPKTDDKSLAMIFVKNSCHIEVAQAGDTEGFVVRSDFTIRHLFGAQNHAVNDIKDLAEELETVLNHNLDENTPVITLFPTPPRITIG